MRAPTSSSPAAALSEVDALLGPEGPLAVGFAGYEHRVEQLTLARAVETAFRRREYLVAEAGTGTGKTLAYLVPAVLSGRKVVISTATKTLQDQLFFKDVQLVKEKLQLDFAAAYVKGRANYLCLHRYEAFSQAPTFVSREEQQLWPMLQSWAEATQSGDRAEVALPEAFPAWRQVSSTSDNCLGHKCPQYDACFVTRMRREAEAGDVVVVNHHLFFADLVVKGRGGGGDRQGVLPKYDAVIFDEAHALEDAATEFFGRSVSSFRFEDLTTDAQRALPPTDERSGLIAAHALKVRAHAEAFFRAAPRAIGFQAGDASVRLNPQSFAGLGRELDEVVHGLAALASVTAGEDESEVTQLARRSSELAADLEFLREASSAEHAYWAEARGRGVSLRSAPIEVREELRRHLYPNVDTVIFTSATLRAAQRFDFFVDRLGLADSQEVPALTELAVPSSFRYAEQAALYLPRHLPEPQAPDFVDAVAEEVLALTALSGGRAFVLFTSLRNLRAVSERLQGRLEYPVWVQGELPKSVLLERFKEEPSVLLASQSFWEGVDVPGDALSLVIIDKLPFGSPGDPLMAARMDRLKERGNEPFHALQLPEAAIALRQGFGRLIRTRQDRGMVAILDRRIVTRAYGRVLLQSLPSVPRFSDRDALGAWWRGG